jgi:hypothetical protein
MLPTYLPVFAYDCAMRTKVDAGSRLGCARDLRSDRSGRHEVGVRDGNRTG